MALTERYGGKVHIGYGIYNAVIVVFWLELLFVTSCLLSCIPKPFLKGFLMERICSSGINSALFEKISVDKGGKNILSDVLHQQKYLYSLLNCLLENIEIHM